MRYTRNRKMKLFNVELDGVDSTDPFIRYAETEDKNGEMRELTDSELDNIDSSVVYELVMAKLFTPREYTRGGDAVDPCRRDT
jgi:hypothetical protein